MSVGFGGIIPRTGREHRPHLEYRPGSSPNAYQGVSKSGFASPKMTIGGAEQAGYVRTKQSKTTQHKVLVPEILTRKLVDLTVVR